MAREPGEGVSTVLVNRVSGAVCHIILSAKTNQASAPKINKRSKHNRSGVPTG